MAPLAVYLAKKGFIVSGSDREYYEPMASVLKQSSVQLFRGYSSENLRKDLALVVVGNAARRDNPEVVATCERKIPYALFPSIVGNLLSEKTHRIVFAGTHGKSTSTALAASTLRAIGIDTSFFVGGEVPELESSLHVGVDSFGVVEGDEYVSAFFANIAKFFFYPATIFVITSLEFDHADIYRDISVIEKAFEDKIASLDNSSVVLVNVDTTYLRELVSKWSNLFSIKFVTYGLHESADIRIYKRIVEVNYQEVFLSIKNKGHYSFRLLLPGEHNAVNAVGVFGALYLSKCDPTIICSGLSKFNGVRRRQEIIYSSSDVVIIEDFAHHPTAVNQTLAALRERFSQYKLLAIFEPRSNSSRKKIFQSEYSKAFFNADLVFISAVQERDGDNRSELLDVPKLVSDLRGNGIEASTFPSADDIFVELESLFKQKLGHREDIKPYLVIIMSNGSFGNLPQRLVNLLS
jgi:UDP-N-acetylmuramate: L-alanyl-gamma-D-glutamyl-meso-diaminopimelate ligase